MAHGAGKRRAILPMAVEDEIAQSLLQTLEMKEDQRRIGVDHHPVAAKPDLVVADIPWREIGADIFDDLHPGRQPRECVEITLIGKTITVDVVTAPLDAFCPPPFHNRDAVRI